MAFQQVLQKLSETTYVDDVFSIDLYEGTGGNRSIVNNIDLAGEGGLVLIRRRESSDIPVWFYEPGKYVHEKQPTNSAGDNISATDYFF